MSLITISFFFFFFALVRGIPDESVVSLLFIEIVGACYPLEQSGISSSTTGPLAPG